MRYDPIPIEGRGWVEEKDHQTIDGSAYGGEMNMKG